MKDDTERLKENKQNSDISAISGGDNHMYMFANKKKSKTIIIAAIIAVVVLAGIGYLSILPKKQAQAEVAEYIESFEQKLSAGDYNNLSTESIELQDKNEKYLSDEEKSELNIRSNYASALDELDLRNNFPTSQPDYYTAAKALDNSNNYGVSDTLKTFLDAYNSEAGDIEGTVIVPPEAKEKDDSVSELPNGSIINKTAWGGGSLPTSDSVKSEGLKSSITESDSSGEGAVKKKEKPKEYPCSGIVFLGFDKINKNGEISEGNIKQEFALEITISNEIKEIDCKEYKAIINIKDKDKFTLTGVDDSTATVKGSFDGSIWTLDFGNGITATMQKPRNTYSSSGSSTSNSSSSSNTKKDYSEGSEWEKYDSDKDGRISDDEFQDATGDYIDEYFEEYGTNGDLNAYDYNGNGEMEDNEFQDATNDYMDNYYDDNSSSSDYSSGSDWEQYDSDYDGKINDSEFQDAVGDWMDSNGY